MIPPLTCVLPAMASRVNDVALVSAPGSLFTCPVCLTTWQLVHLAANGAAPQPHWMTTKVGL